jgi:DedD protein
MAFFKLRKAAGETSAPAPAPESVDALRKRARYRLAGAALLVLAGVVGFPLLFDNQPRPIAVDIPIDIPDKAKVKPLAVLPAAENKAVDGAKLAQAPAAAAPESSDSRAVAGQPALANAKAPPPEPKPAVKEVQKEEVVISSSKTAIAAVKADARAEAKAETKIADKAAAKPAEKSADKPVDKSNEKASDKASASTRFVVQFGAFTDSAHAHEARLKVEKAGLKTYAQIAETPEGKKFRVRVGPFDSRSEAEKTAEKIKKIGLPAAILGL